MPTRFQTPTMLPDMANRRYGLLELGTQNVEIIRGEHQRLMRACAALLDTAPETLTYEDIEILATRRLAPPE